MFVQTKWKSCSGEIVCVLFVVVVLCVENLDCVNVLGLDYCPAVGTQQYKSLEWKFCQKTERLHCQESGDSSVISFCHQPRECAPGLYARLYPDRTIKCELCPTGSYEPVGRASYLCILPVCSHQHRTCETNGKKMCKEGTPIEDTKCSCDYQQQYAPSPENCHCFTFNEPCQCLKSNCEGKLNSSFHCVLDTTTTEKTTEKSTAEPEGTTRKPSVSETEERTNTVGLIAGLIAGIITVIVVAFIIFGVICYKKGGFKMVTAFDSRKDKKDNDKETVINIVNSGGRQCVQLGENSEIIIKTCDGDTNEQTSLKPLLHVNHEENTNTTCDGDSKEQTLSELLLHVNHDKQTSTVGFQTYCEADEQTLLKTCDGDIKEQTSLKVPTFGENAFIT